VLAFAELADIGFSIGAHTEIREQRSEIKNSAYRDQRTEIRDQKQRTQRSEKKNGKRKAAFSYQPSATPSRIRELNTDL